MASGNGDPECVPSETVTRLPLNESLDSYAELLAEMHAQTSAAVDATLMSYVLARPFLA